MTPSLLFGQAEGDARLAAKMAPTWSKPLHRLALALQVPCLNSLCRSGSAIAREDSSFHALRVLTYSEETCNMHSAGTAPLGGWHRSLPSRHGLFWGYQGL